MLASARSASSRAFIAMSERYSLFALSYWAEAVVSSSTTRGSPARTNCMSRTRISFTIPPERCATVLRLDSTIVTPAAGTPASSGASAAQAKNPPTSTSRISIPMRRKRFASCGRCSSATTTGAIAPSMVSSLPAGPVNNFSSLITVHP